MAPETVIQEPLHDLCDVWCCVYNALTNLDLDVEEVPSLVLFYAFSGIPGECTPFRSFVPLHKIEEATQAFIDAASLSMMDPDLEGFDSLVDALGAIFPAASPVNGELVLQGFLVTKYSPDSLLGFTHALRSGPSVVAVEGPDIGSINAEQVPEFLPLIEQWRTLVESVSHLKGPDRE